MAAYENYNEGNTGLAASQAMQGFGSSVISGGRLLGMGFARVAGVYSAILSIANADIQALTNIYYGNAEVDSAFGAADALVDRSISLMSDAGEIRMQMKDAGCK